MGEDKNLSIPLIIGITGHRDILHEDLPRVRAAIQAALTEYGTRYGDANLVLITMLSAGADLLAAEAALERGIKIVGLLPFDVNLYRRDFTDPAELSRFNSILRACSAVYEMPAGAHAPQDPVSQESISRQGMARDALYALGGACVARFSHALIAVWDGLDPALRGGTADVVRMRLDGEDGASRGPVLWIYARRTKAPLASPTPPNRLPFECEIDGEKPDRPYVALYPKGEKPGTAHEPIPGPRFAQNGFFAQLGALIGKFGDEMMYSRLRHI